MLGLETCATSSSPWFFVLFCLETRSLYLALGAASPESFSNRPRASCVPGHQAPYPGQTPPTALPSAQPGHVAQGRRHAQERLLLLVHGGVVDRNTEKQGSKYAAEDSESSWCRSSKRCSHLCHRRTGSRERGRGKPRPPRYSEGSQRRGFVKCFRPRLCDVLATGKRACA